MTVSTLSVNDFRSYNEAEIAVREQAIKEFDATPATDKNDRQRREASRQAANEAVNEWFFTQPALCSIWIRRGENDDEIRDEFFNGSITVYGPSREYDYAASRAAEKDIYKIVPGYVNASSWSAGTRGASVQYTQREMEHRLHMMSLALDCLNKRNVLVLEWAAMESPFRLAGEARQAREAKRAERAKAQEESAALRIRVREYLASNGDSTPAQIGRSLKASAEAVGTTLTFLANRDEIARPSGTSHYRLTQRGLDAIVEAAKQQESVA